MYRPFVPSFWACSFVVHCLPIYRVPSYKALDQASRSMGTMQQAEPNAMPPVSCAAELGEERDINSKSEQDVFLDRVAFARDAAVSSSCSTVANTSSASHRERRILRRGMDERPDSRGQMLDLDSLALVRESFDEISVSIKASVACDTRCEQRRPRVAPMAPGGIEERRPDIENDGTRLMIEPRAPFWQESPVSVTYRAIE